MCDKEEIVLWGPYQLSVPVSVLWPTVYISRQRGFKIYYVFLSSRHMFPHSSGDSLMVTTEKIDQGGHKILSPHTRNALVMPKYCTVFLVAPSLHVKKLHRHTHHHNYRSALQRGSTFLSKAFPSIAVSSRMGTVAKSRSAFQPIHLRYCRVTLPCLSPKAYKSRVLSALLSLRCENQSRSARCSDCQADQ